MRLHLDTSNVTGTTGAVNGGAPVSSSGRSAEALTNGDGVGSSPDRVAVSGASRAWAASFSDRASRIQQLTGAVQNGTYRVSSTALSQSIVASALG